MIRSFRDAAIARLFADEDVPRFRGIERQARRKLLMLDNAGALSDLRRPPGNRLEALKGDRQGQHSIRIINGASASCGARAARNWSKSWITIEDKGHGENKAASPYPAR